MCRGLAFRHRKYHLQAAPPCPAVARGLGQPGNHPMPRLTQAVAYTLGIAAKGTAKMQVRAMKEAKGDHGVPCCGKVLWGKLAANGRTIKAWHPLIRAVDALSRSAHPFSYRPPAIDLQHHTGYEIRLIRGQIKGRICDVARLG